MSQKRFSKSTTDGSSARRRTPNCPARKFQDLILETAKQGIRFSSKELPAEIGLKLERVSWWWRYVDDSVDPNSGELTSNGNWLQAEYGVDPLVIKNLQLIMANCQEYPAFVYEMGVRIMQPELVPTPWLRLSQSIKVPLIEAFERPRIVRIGASLKPNDSVPASEDYWTDQCPWRFNLLTTDSEIVETFLTFFINQQRHEKGLLNPRPNAGRRNRGFSWKPIENFDRQRFGETLDDSDRSQLSKAQREVKAALGM